MGDNLGRELFDTLQEYRDRKVVDETTGQSISLSLPTSPPVSFLPPSLSRSLSPPSLSLFLKGRATILAEGPLTLCKSLVIARRWTTLLTLGPFYKVYREHQKVHEQSQLAWLRLTQ